jgi:hypothetical protein
MARISERFILGRHSLGSQSQYREQIRQIDEPFRFATFVGRERLALILLIEQGIQSMLNPIGQVEFCQIVGYFQLKSHGLRHGNLRSERQSHNANSL